MAQFIFTAGIWDSMPKWLATILLTILHFIDQVVYVLINWMYRVFILVSEVDIFKDGTQINAIVNRIYVIVGIAMLFIFAYNLVLLIINPEGKQLGNMAKVVQNAIISVILIIFLPTIFSYLKIVQNHIVTENVIGNIILGTTSDYDAAENTNKRAGVKVALDIYSAFYHPVNESYVTCKNKCGTDGSGCKDSICYDYVLAYNNAYKNSNIADFIWDKNLRDGVKDGKVEYLGIVSTVAGAFALWMFVSFALDIGIRVGKLAFYEIISPIPVMMRILPGDKMFDKWFKGLKDTYLSIFIRLIIIYTCMYFITLVPDIFANMWASGDAGIIVALANVVVILGILQFAKDAPKLISDMFGGGGDLKFGIKDKYKSAAAPLGRVADMARSGVYSKMYGGKDGAGGSFFAGAWRGRHGFDKGRQATDAYSEAISDGSTLGGRTIDRLRLATGMKTRYDSVGSDVDKQMKKEKIEKRREHNKMVADSISTLKDKAGSVVTDKDSKYASSGSYYSISDVNTRKTYDLSNKNHYEMKAVLEQAIRDNANAATITALERSIAGFEKQTKDLVIDDVLKNNTANIQGRHLTSMQNAVVDLQEQISEGAAETVDVTTGKLVSGIKDSSGNIITSISDISELKAADNAVKASNREIDLKERDIKKKDAKFKAKKADRDYINKTDNKGGK